MTKLLLDKVSYTQKPEGYEIGALNKRLSINPVNITPLELVEEINAGRTFVGATLKEVNDEILRKKDNWQSQTVIALDFDEGLTIENTLKEEFLHLPFLYQSLCSYYFFIWLNIPTFEK